MEKRLLSDTKVSIIIPCYNVEKYLPICLDSILGQTLTDIEVICIDDGSTDRTQRILRSYSSKDSRIVLIEKDNSGYGDTVNLGINKSRGEYIGIIESDDFVEKNMFETLYDCAKKYRLDIARCCYFRYSDGRDILECLEGVPKNKIIKPIDCVPVFYQAPSVWANIYRSEWLKNEGIKFLSTPGASFQDTSFLFKAYAMADRLMVVDKPLHHYRIDNSSSSIHSNKKIFAVNEEWREIYSFVRKHRTKISEELFNNLQALQFRTYKWNLCRIGPEFRKKFIMRWSEEVRQLDRDGMIHWKKIGMRTAKRLFLIKFFPRLFFISRKVLEKSL